MPTRPADRLPAVHATLAFNAWRSAPNIMPRAHTHSDIEFNLPLGGNMEYFFGGRFVRVPVGQIALFWAGVPHRLIARTPGAEYLCLTLPLAWFLAWRIAGGDFAARLLGGEMLVRPASPMETAQFTGWTDDFGAISPVREAISLLEVEAFLRRVALEGSPGASPTAGSLVAGRQAERITASVGQTFRDPDLTAEKIAAAAHLHPKYLLTLFRQECGMTLWEYVTRLRVSHAQRLLLTTGDSMERIAGDSGFGSATRFFAAFKAHTGTTPRRYRVQNG